jgi:hypothetical protein
MKRAAGPRVRPLAAEILVEAASGPAEAGGDRARLAIGADRLGLIEIEEHGRMLFDGEQHVGKFAQDVRPYRLEFEQTGEADHGQFVGRDREMIGPEMGHPLEKGRGPGQRGIGSRLDHRDIIAARGLADEAACAVGQAGEIVLHVGRAGLLHRLTRRGGLHPGLTPAAARGCRLVRCLTTFTETELSQPALAPNLFEIIGQLPGHLGARGGGGDRRRARIETLELGEKPGPRVRRRRVAGARTEPEAIECNGNIRHRHRSPSAAANPRHSK